MTENDNEERKLVVDFKRYSLSTGEVPELAELRIQPLKHHGQGHPRSHGHHVLRVAIYDQSGKHVYRRSYRTNYKDDKKAGEIVYDITPLIQDMVAMGLTNMTVKMTLNQDRINKDGNRNKRSMAQVKADKAFLVVYSQDKFFLGKFNKMMKRQQKHSFGKNLPKSFSNKLGFGAHISGQKRSSHDICGKVDYVVDLRKLGLGILWPRYINAFMCTGYCPRGEHVYGIIRVIYKKNMENSRPIPQPCCVPKTYGSGNFIVHESKMKVGIILFPKIKVTDCECR